MAEKNNMSIPIGPGFVPKNDYITEGRPKSVNVLDLTKCKYSKEVEEKFKKRNELSEIKYNLQKQRIMLEESLGKLKKEHGGIDIYKDIYIDYSDEIKEMADKLEKKLEKDLENGMLKEFKQDSFIKDKSVKRNLPEEIQKKVEEIKKNTFDYNMLLADELILENEIEISLLKEDSITSEYNKCVAEVEKKYEESKIKTKVGQVKKLKKYSEYLDWFKW